MIDQKINLNLLMDESDERLIEWYLDITGEKREDLMRRHQQRIQRLLEEDGDFNWWEMRLPQEVITLAAERNFLHAEVTR